MGTPTGDHTDLLNVWGGQQKQMPKLAINVAMLVDVSVNIVLRQSLQQFSECRTSASGPVS